MANHYIDTTLPTIAFLLKMNLVNCVKESANKIFISLQYELITIALDCYPQPIKSVVTQTVVNLPIKFFSAHNILLILT